MILKPLKKQGIIIKEHYKMTKSTKTSKKDQGCVAFAYGGVLKQNTIRLFKSSGNKPESDQESLSKYYGTISIRYVNCETSMKFMINL